MAIIYIIVFLILIGISFYFGKSNEPSKKKLFAIYSIMMIALGVISSFFIKSIFLMKLNKATQTNALIDNNFILWASDRFDSYFKISYIYVAIVLSLLIFSLYTDKTIRNRESSRSFSYINILSMVVLFIASNIYCFSTINKNFDLSLYIGFLSICQIFILHLPIIAKRLYIGNPSIGCSNLIY